MAETEPEKEKKAASPNAAENVIAGIFSFDPLKFLRTLRWVIREPDKIAEAIGSQTWDEILSPTKYFSACLVVFFIGWWVRSGETSAPEWSFTHIFIYIFFVSIVLPFLLAQYAYLWFVSVKKEPNIVQGIAKIFQCYALTVGSALASLGLSFALFQSSESAEKANLAPLDSIMLYLSGFGFLISASLFIFSPQTILSKLYKLSERSVLIAFFLGVAAALAGMMITGAVWRSIDPSRFKKADLTMFLVCSQMRDGEGPPIRSSLFSRALGRQR